MNATDAPRLAFLVSGRGSNMVALVEAARREAWPVELAGVLADRPEAAALAQAQRLGLRARCVHFRDHPRREDFDAALAQALLDWKVHWVVLAGFMRVLGEGLVRAHQGRLINIHPSLLPAFPGLHTHRRALEAGCRFAGATVHLVTPELDHGPILGQAVVAVQPDDTETTLAARVLAAEHRLYPAVLGAWLRGEYRQQQGRWQRHDGRASGWVEVPR